MVSQFYNQLVYDVETVEVMRMLNSILVSTSMSRRAARIEIKNADIECPEVIDAWLHNLLNRFDKHVDRVAARLQQACTKNPTEADLQFQAQFEADFAAIRLCCELYPVMLLTSVALDKKLMRLPGDLLLRLIVAVDDGFAGVVTTRGMLAIAQAAVSNDFKNIADFKWVSGAFAEGSSS